MRSLTSLQLLGYDQGVMAGLIGSPDTPFSRTFKNPDATTLGIMVAIYEIGCFFGAMFILFYGERFGRRVCMIGGGSVMLVGAVLQCTSYSMAQLIVGRIITGLVSNNEGNVVDTGGQLTDNILAQRVTEQISHPSQYGLQKSRGKKFEDKSLPLMDGLLSGV